MKNRINLSLIILSIIFNSICLSQLKLHENEPPGKDFLKIQNSPDGSNRDFFLIKRDSIIKDFIGRTHDCDIYLKDRSLLKGVNITRLIDSTVTIDKEGVKKQFNVKEINKIRFPGVSGFWTGAGIGAGVSVVGWTLIGLAFGREDGIGPGLVIGLAGAIPCGLLGGLVGLIYEKEAEYYDLSSGNPKAKLKRLRYILDKETPKFIEQ